MIEYDKDPNGYYRALGLSPDATPEEIKAAYRRLALKHHPDKNPTNKEEATKKFQDLGSAYNVLNDPQKRKQYDAQARAGSQGFNFGGSGMDWSDIFTTSGGSGGWFGGGIEDLFAQYFGGGSGGARSQSKPSPVEWVARSEITLEEASRGAQIHETIVVEVKCGDCGGGGVKTNSKCAACSGAGTNRFRQGPYIVSQQCESCYGTGKVVCGGCRGRGCVPQQQSRTIQLPPGIRHGAKVKVAAGGNFGGGGYGDLFVTVRVKPHNLFHVLDSGDLKLEVCIPLSVALLGGVMQIPCIDGTSIQLVIPKSTQNNQEFVIPRKGMGGMHSMRVIVQVEMPEHLSQKQIALLQGLEWTEANHPRATKRRKLLDDYCAQ